MTGCTWGGHPNHAALQSISWFTDNTPHRDCPFNSFPICCESSRQGVGGGEATQIGKMDVPFCCRHTHQRESKEDESLRRVRTHRWGCQSPALKSQVPQIVRVIEHKEEVAEKKKIYFFYQEKLLFFWMSIFWVCTQKSQIKEKRLFQR